MKTIAICTLKGGAGKTTTCIYLSQLLSGRKLIIDLDPQSNISSFYNIDFKVMVKYNIMTALSDKKLFKKCITNIGYIDIIPGTLKLSDFESNFAGELGKELLVKDALDISLDYDYILLDTSPSFGIITRNALFAADALIIPVDPHIWSIEGGMKIIENIESIKKSALKKELTLDRIFILPIKYDSKIIFADYEKDFMKALRENFGGYKVLSPVGFYSNLKKYQSKGKLMPGKITKEYKKIVEEIHAEG